jgi:hypothetical protein
MKKYLKYADFLFLKIEWGIFKSNKICNFLGAGLNISVCFV